MLKPNTSTKSPIIELTNATRLPNGNVVKFSHTNRKHLTVSDPMAFPIVKMKNKIPQNVPYGYTLTPHLIQQCLGEARPTASTTPNRSSDGWGTVAHLRRKVPIGYNGAPQICPQKYPFLWTVTMES